MPERRGRPAHVNSLMPSRLITAFINFLYPSDCPSCGGVADNMPYSPFCKSCWSSIERYSGPACKICSAPFSSEYAHLCGECGIRPPLFSRAICFGLYDGVLANAINVFKFQKIRRLYRPLGKLLLDLDVKEMDAVIPVPLSAKGLRERGFNQSLLLSKFISDKTGIPLIADGLVKNIETHPQIGLSARERVSNLRRAFDTTRPFTGMSLLLVDDVMTTGATVNECTKQLLKAGAEGVVVLALARARSD